MFCSIASMLPAFAPLLDIMILLYDIGGLVYNCSNFSALALKLL